MTDRDTQMLSHDAFDTLAPWYVTGRLEADERAQVEAYLAAYPQAAARLELIEDERFGSVVSNEAIGGPPAGALDDLLAQIDAEAPAQRLRAAGWRERAADWFAEVRDAFGKPALQLAGGIAAVVILAQAIALGALMLSVDGARYRTASGGNTLEVSGVTDVLVRFNEGARAGEIAAFLSARKARIVDGPKPGGLYRIRFEGATTDKAERARRIATLRKAANIIVFAVPAKASDSAAGDGS